MVAQKSSTRIRGLNLWKRLCHLNGIKISMSHKGGSTDNAHIERFWKTLKFDGFYLAFAKTMIALKSMLSHFIHWYNEKRLHNSLKYKTPMEVKNGGTPDLCICGYRWRVTPLPTDPTTATTSIRIFLLH